MKAILILDMPKSCGECPFRTSLSAEHLVCTATLPRLRIDPMAVKYIKEHKCPLKPIPDKDEVLSIEEYRKANSRERVQSDFNEGFNYCLETITGETE